MPFHRPLCAVEVGTASGKGTTVALHSMLEEYGKVENAVAGGGRGDTSFVIHTYEGVPGLYQQAREKWGSHGNVHLYNELFITEKNLEE